MRDRGQVGSSLGRRAVSALLVAWLLFALTSFRLPWRPIVVSDADAAGALRKLLFASCGAVGLLRLLECRALGRAAALHAGPLALAGLLFASVVYSPAPGLTVKRAVVFSCGLLLLAAFTRTETEPRQRLIRAVVGAGGLAAWASLAAAAALPPECSSIAERPGLAGVAGHPNTLGAFVGIALVLSWGLEARTRVGRLTTWTLRAGSALALVATNSITALLFVLVASLLFLGFRSHAYRRGALLLTAAGGLAVAAPVWLHVGHGAALRLVGRDPSLSGRDVLWSRLLDEVARRPVFGSGFGAFWTEGRGRELVGTWNPRQAHNAFLDLLVDLGAVGLLTALVVIGGGLLRARCSRLRGAERREAAALAACGWALLGMYGWGESLLLRVDKASFFVLLGAVFVLRTRPAAVGAACESEALSSRAEPPGAGVAFGPDRALPRPRGEEARRCASACSTTGIGDPAARRPRCGTSETRSATAATTCTCTRCAAMR